MWTVISRVLSNCFQLEIVVKALRVSPHQGVSQHSAFSDKILLGSSTLLTLPVADIDGKNSIGVVWFGASDIHSKCVTFLHHLYDVTHHTHSM